MKMSKPYLKDNKLMVDVSFKWYYSIWWRFKLLIQILFL